MLRSASYALYSFREACFGRSPEACSGLVKGNLELTFLIFLRVSVVG